MSKRSDGLSRFWYVQSKDQLAKPSTLYHENSKLGEFRVRFGETDPKRTQQMIDLINTVAGKKKGYDHLLQCPLARSDWSDLSSPLGELLKHRRSCRQLAACSLSRQQLSDLLLFSAGVNGELRYAPDATRPLRTYPSGGALYPLEIYPVLLNVDELESGLYYLDIYSPTLSILSVQDLRNTLREAFIEEPMIDHAAAVVLITAVFTRSRFKYGERAYRFVLLEAGHLAQNFILTGQALGLSVVPMGGFLDRRLEELLGVDGVEESIVYPLIVGVPSSA